MALLLHHILCNHICPTCCALWVSLSIPSAMSHGLSGPSFPKEENNEKIQECSLPSTQTGEFLSLLCRRIPGLGWKWHKLWAQPCTSRDTSSHIQVTSFLLNISQKLWGFHHFSALPGSSTATNSCPPSLRQGYPQLPFESRCLYLAPLCYRTGWPMSPHHPIRIAVEASLNHLQAYLPEKHWKKLNIQCVLVIKRSPCLKKYQKVKLGFHVAYVVFFL